MDASCGCDGDSGLGCEDATERGAVGVSIEAGVGPTLVVSLSLISFSLLSFFKEDVEDSVRREEDDFLSPSRFLVLFSWLLERPSY